jgi:hypothetical protein
MILINKTIRVATQATVTDSFLTYRQCQHIYHSEEFREEGGCPSCCNTDTTPIPLTELFDELEVDIWI